MYFQSTECTAETITFFVTGIVFAYSLLRLIFMLSPSLGTYLLGHYQTTTKVQPTPALLNPSETKMYSLSVLEEYHNELDARFVRHQELLVSGSIRKALWMLNFYTDQLKIHNAEETQVILPMYKANSPLDETEKNRSTSLYATEQKRCMNLLSEVHDILKELGMRRKEDYPREIVHILELEFRVKELLRRHDGREHRDLYPGAEYNTTESTRKHVWEECIELRQNMGFCL